ncbi:MAG: phosphoenolpyruvate carboxykinase, partial [Syntrophothermus sp.]
DDLEPGFAYTEIDRSIFMNPHRTNARLVIPLTPYQEVVAGYPVDMFLYANNYEQVDETHPHIELYSDESTAFQVFSQGARVSKGTTDEQGLVHTYFANPFGAPQKREKYDPLAKAYLRVMLANGVKVGQLRTRLGIAGYELGGPESAARALFEFITRG